jgi:hypothetical protein
MGRRRGSRLKASWESVSLRAAGRCTVRRVEAERGAPRYGRVCMSGREVEAEGETTGVASAYSREAGGPFCHGFVNVFVVGAVTKYL